VSGRDLPADAATVELLLEAQRETNALLRQVVAALRRDPQAQALVVALRERFGTARFSVGALLVVATEDPHSRLGEAVAEAVDLNGGSRAAATALGRLLSRLALDVEVVGEAGNAKVYRLRT
jgi:hypothetical protein